MYLEATGTIVRANGERIAYHLMHSIAYNGVRELQDQYDIVRGQLSFCHLYRQRSPGVVELYLKGFLDPLGDVFASIAIAHVRQSVDVDVEIARVRTDEEIGVASAKCTAGRSSAVHQCWCWPNLVHDLPQRFP